MLFKNKKRKKASAIRQNVLPRKSKSRQYVIKFMTLVLLVGGVYLLNYLFVSLQMFPVKHVRVEGEFNYLKKDLIEKKVDRFSVGGFFDIDIVSLRAELLRMQWVEDAYVRREWPDAVIIRVIEKHAVAKWDRTGVLTSNGDLFYPAETTDTLHLVELNGPENRHEFVLAEFNKMQSLLSQADIQISKFSQNERRSWKMEMGDVTINLGRKNIYKKIESLAGVYSSLIKPKIDRIKQIDFRYTNGFSVVWKNDLVKIMSLKYTREMKMSQITVDLTSMMGTIKNV